MRNILMQAKVRLKNFCHKNASTCFIDRCCGVDWTECAVKHDLDYESLKKGDSTKRSDVKFLACLKKKSWKSVAYLMYAAVRLFGRKFKGEN